MNYEELLHWHICHTHVIPVFFLLHLRLIHLSRQIVGDNNANATVDFVRRVIAAKTKDPAKLASLLSFDALALRRQKFPPFKASTYRRVRSKHFSASKESYID